jgi:acyl-homoserine-lactone acylase
LSLPPRPASPPSITRRQLRRPSYDNYPKVLIVAGQLTAAAFDSYLPAFATMIPVLVKAYDAAPASDPLKAGLSNQMSVLRAWDYRWGVNSVATSLAVFWGTDIFAHVQARAAALGISPESYVVEHATRQQLLASLAAASHRLMADFGSWETPWGRINRFQRLNDDIRPSFDDAKASIPVPFTSSLWGSLAAFGSQPYPNTKRWYGNVGNSFVAVVEFGPQVRAWAITAGGESGNPTSPHFDDEAAQYAMGELRPVYYYKSQLKGQIKQQYHPGEDVRGRAAAVAR